MAKKHFQKALSVGLSLALCASLAAPAFAASFTELQGAINTGNSVYQEDGTTYKIEASKDETGAVNVKLHEDVERGEEESYINIATGKNVTIDLNGHDIVDETTQTGITQETYNIVVQGTLSVEGEGTIKSDNTNVIANYSENSTLNLNGGTIEATGETGRAIYTKGTTTISEDAVVKGGSNKKDSKTYGAGVYANGGTVTTSGDVSGYFGIYAANGTVNVKGGNVESESSYGIYATSGNKTNITGGNVTGETQGVHIGNGGKVTVAGEDVTITGKKEAGIGVFGNGSGEYSELTVKQGTIQGGNFGIAGNGTAHNTKIIVEGGTVTGDYAGIYHPQDGTLIIGTEGSDKGPTITGTGNNASGTGNGVQMCAGEATIYGGTIKGSGESDTENKTGDGIIPDGSAVSAVSRKGYGKEENRTEEGYSQPKVTIHVDHVNMDPNDTTFQWANSEAPGQKPADWTGNGETSGIFDENHTVIIDPYVAPTYTSIGWTEGSHCDVCGVIVPQQPIPMLAAPEDPGEVEIEDPDVPLAGLFTRGDAIGYLWEQSGSPEAELSTFEDVPEDHQWAVAIGWAQDMGIAVADLEGNFRPDDLVLHSVEDIELSPEGELQEFLNRYAVYAGIVLEPGELFIELDGAWDDIVMGEDAQVIFDDFFARLELALAAAA